MQTTCISRDTFWWGVGWSEEKHIRDKNSNTPARVFVSGGCLLTKIGLFKPCTRCISCLSNCGYPVKFWTSSIAVELFMWQCISKHGNAPIKAKLGFKYLVHWTNLLGPQKGAQCIKAIYNIQPTASIQETSTGYLLVSATCKRCDPNSILVS